MNDHPCDACRACETCERDAEGDVVCTVDSSVAFQCGDDGNIHRLNACGDDEGIDTRCPSNADCVDRSDSSATCECLFHWTGDDCETCPGNFDPEEDCDACRNAWTGDDCEICPGNFDSDEDCDACRNAWTGDDCETCPGNFNPDEDCDACRNAWTGDDCETCPGNFDPDEDCDVCRNAWTGDDCETCPGNFDPGEDCNACRNAWTGDDCEICPEILDESSDCSICKGNRDDATDCATCRNHWIDDENDCGTCPGNWDAKADCNVCRNQWQDNDDNCGTCPGNWDAETDCSTCRNQWQDNVNDCGTCPGRWAVDSDCAECLPGWTGTDCNRQAECAIYVDSTATAAGADGAWWTRAFPTVNQGIAEAASRVALSGGNFPCDVRVAAGRYFIYENAATDTVALSPGVHLLGGFSGTEIHRDERDHLKNETVIDGHQSPGSSAQVYHVVTGSDDAIIDGFTITGGRADDKDVSKYAMGGGMLNFEVTPAVVNCTFQDNYAASGGGIYNYNTEEVRIQGCRFIANSAKFYGGGLRNFNAASQITDTQFIDNTAHTGAGLDNSGSVTEITSVVFENNTAGDAGGGIYSTLGTLSISNTIFNSNQTNNAGGALYVLEGLHSVINTTFYGNSAPYDGGAAIYLSSNSTPKITNCIFFGNRPDDISPHNSADPTVTYSLVEEGYSGEGNLSIDPLFADPQNGNLHLLPGSPAIDAGNSAVAPEKDIEGNSRFDDPDTVDTGLGSAPLPDLGAFEFLK